MPLRILAIALLATLCACSRTGGQPDPKVGALISQLRSDDLNARLKAAEQLRQMGPAASAAVPALIVNLGSGRDGRRQLLNVAATNALLRIGPGAALPALIEAVKGQDRDVAYGAAFTIGGFGKAAKPAVPVLLAALEDPAVRPAAHNALQMIDEES